MKNDYQERINLAKYAMLEKKKEPDNITLLIRTNLKLQDSFFVIYFSYKNFILNTTHNYKVICGTNLTQTEEHRSRHDQWNIKAVKLQLNILLLIWFLICFTVRLFKER